MAIEGLTWCLGIVSVIDTALLLGCLERRNLSRVIGPVVVLLAAVWAFHVGEFSNLLLAESSGWWSERARVVAMAVMAGGLLAAPCALLHGALRLWRSGLDTTSSARIEYSLAYLPLAIWPLGVRSILEHADARFLTRVDAYVIPYLGLCAVATAATLVSIRRFQRQSRISEQRRFLQVLAGLVVLLLALLGATVAALRAGWIADKSPWIAVAILSPALPTLWFAYYVIRYQFLELVLERTVVYGAIVAGAVLLHGFLQRHTTDPLEDRLHVDLGMLEALLILVLILGYQPLRRRVAESLRFLLGRNAADFRVQTRRLAVEQWEHLGDPPQALLDWFVPAVAQAFDVSRAAGWLFELPEGTLRSGNTEFPAAATRALYDALPPHSFVTVNGGPGVSWQTVDLLRSVRASLAVRVDHARVSGLLLLGRRSRARDFSEEEAQAALLLAELLGATLHGHYLLQQRQEIERAAARQEKLATLGLLTTCLAHEIKNPLSSIKTIATLLSEADPDSEDIRLILAEIERLGRTTSQFLQFARPTAASEPSADLASVVMSSVQMLAHLARSRGVTVTTEIASELPPSRGDRTALREIVFNLLLNAIEAVDRGGQVRVSLQPRTTGIRLEVSDNGPGIPPEDQARIFDPFFTSKPSGTGLGLYIVRRNVEQLGGSIECVSQSGTTFVVEVSG